MNFALYTDSSANLSEAEVVAKEIGVVSLTLSLNGEEMVCYEPGVVFDHDAFFQRMREDATLEMKTSMVNTEAFLSAFEPHLQAGEDVLYLGISGGISGTCGAGQKAAEILSEKYAERKVYVVDTLTATIGEALIVREAAKMRADGVAVDLVAAHARRRSHEVRSYFMVDDLNFLKRGGRISKTVAMAGSIMHLKPILKGDEEGKIVLDLKIFGRQKALKTLAEIFERLHVASEENCQIGIAHTGCEEEAHLLASDIIERCPDVQAAVVPFEPCTASHIGPDAVALFFF